MFGNLPLHPAIVHIPMGLTVLLPVITLVLGLLYFRNFIGKKGLIAVSLLHLMLGASSYMALETGEEEEDKVERVVNESHIERHEEKAEVFMVATIVLGIFSLVIFMVPTGILFNVSLSALIVAQLGLGFLGYQVGHSGGELVYVYGAGQAYTGNNLMQPDSDAKSGNSEHDEHDD